VGVRPLDCLTDLRDVGHVEGHGQDRVAKTIHKISQRTCVAGGRGDLVSASESRFGPDPPKTA
jgi:hypothetical protein